MFSHLTLRLVRIGQIATRTKDLDRAVAFFRDREEHTLAIICEVPR